ncbi:probable galacturonosyltransferase 6 isoform X2 [Cornus florida]|uniref:probable galacturonosyltransferase 6 isoform X2 n=1 Tax=Cornus florida TaxID=4283 RepID=UPI00289D2393|nr:probable galacturonosyltransferase 6 isoform X2 [Cornus florida]
MKQLRRCTRIIILSLLAVSVFVPMFLLSDRLKTHTSDASEVFSEDLTNIKIRTDAQKLNAIEQEVVEGFKEPTSVVYKDGALKSVVSYSSTEENTESEETGSAKSSTNTPERNGTNQDAREANHQNQLGKVSFASDGNEQSKQATVRHDQNVQSKSQRPKDVRIKQMRDQVIRAKAYLNFAPPNSNSQLVRELRLRIKEVEKAVGECTQDSQLPRNALQKMRSMEGSLSKASRIYKDCSAMAMKLRAMTHNAEERIRTQKNQVSYLVRLAGMTTPKGLHCLSMRLTAEFFALPLKERELPNQHKLQNPDLYHFAVFSDNVLASAVVVNSTISSASEPERIAFHVVTDSLYLPAISMWFLLNPPGKATVQVQSVETFGWLSSKYGATLQKKNSRDLRYTSALNHLRFYLPDVFPMLNKILFLDHDVVVQRDLTGLWNLNMMGKVVGAVQTCPKDDEPSFRQMDTFINFSDPFVAKRFDVKACTWAFGMNIFDLREWRRRNLTGLYHKYLQLGNKRPLWKAGSLPIGWVTFYKQTVALNGRWHVLGLGYDSSVRRSDIEQAAVIHYDGLSKPWLEIGIEEYKAYWWKHIDNEHPYLQHCNIQS